MKKEIKIKQIDSKTISKKTREKYNLTNANDNLGFTWEVLLDILPWQFRRQLCFNGLEILAETGRWIGKSFGQCAILLWKLLNFDDYNAFVGRKDKSTHTTTTIRTFKKVAKLLLEKYDIDIGPDNPFGIQWNTKISATNNMPEIVYRDRRIMFDSVGKFQDGALGLEFETGGIGDIWADEVSKPSKEDVSDSTGEEIYDNVRQIYGSAIRGDFIPEKEFIKEFNCKVPMQDEEGKFIEDEHGEEYEFYIEGVLTTKRLKTETIYFYKRAHITFTLNAWDEMNFFHERYFEDLWEYDYKVMQNIYQQNSLQVYKDNNQVLLFRARAWMAKDNGHMNEATYLHFMELKEIDYTYYCTVVDGLVLETSNLSKFVYREDMKHTTIVDFNKEIWVDERLLEPEYITIGIDWGWSKVKAKKSVIVVTGYMGKYKNRYWEYEFPFMEWSEESKSVKVQDEQWKLESAADFIFKVCDKYQSRFKPKIIVWIDEADKTVGSSIQEKIWRKYRTNIEFKLGAKHDSQNMWGINSRQQFAKEQLSSGRVFLDPKSTPVLYKELMQMIKAKGSKKRDPRCAQDATTAWEYSKTLLRFFILKSKADFKEVRQF